MAGPYLIEYFQNLVALAYADGIIDPREEKFLISKAIEYGYDLSELKELIDYAPNIQFVKPASYYRKANYVQDVVDMVMCDGIFSETERTFLKKVCVMIDIDDRHLFELIEFKNVKQA